MSATNFTDITVDPRGGVVLAPIATLPVAGTLGFLPGGNLLVLERRFDDACVVVHELGPGGEGFTELRSATLKGFRGSPVGCAVSPAGTRVAVGLKTAKVYTWPGGKAVASMPAVHYELELNSLGFSPSGALLAVADGGYVSPRKRMVYVCDAATGGKLATVKTGEWNFVQAQLLDESTLVTLGLALGWEYGDAEQYGQRVLGCYDVDSGALRWRRTLRAGQFAGVDGAAGLGWVAADDASRATTSVLGLAASDGRVVHELGFGGRWRPAGAAPVVLGPTLLGLALGSAGRGGGCFAVVDVASGQQIAALAGADRLEAYTFPPVGDRGTRRVAGVVAGETLVWQVP